MKKKTRQLILLVGILVLLAAAYLLVTALTGEDEGTAADGETTANTYHVCAIDQTTLYKLSYTFAGKEYAFTLNGDATAWLWNDDPSLPLDNLRFANMVTVCQGLTSTVRLTDVSPAQLAEFGLGASAQRITFTDTVGGERAYLIGAYNSYNGMRYFCDESNPSTVYMVDGTLTDAFSLTPYDMIRLPDLPTDITPANLVRVTLTPADSTLATAVYTYYSGGKAEGETDVWYVSFNGGTEQPVSAKFGNNLSTSLATLAFSDLVSYRAEEQAAFGLGTPTTMTIDYKVTQSFQDETTGKTTHVNVDHSTSLLLGDVAENGLCFATVEDSVLTCTLMGEVFTDMLQACATVQAP